MTEPLDVSLRVRMRYEAGGAKQALGDLDQISGKAARLGAGGAARLGQGLKAIGSEAKRAQRDMVDLTTATARLGQDTGASKLEAGLKGARAPAQGLARDMLDIRSAAERLGAGRGVDKLGHELRDATRHADELERKLGEMERRLGRARHGGEGREFGNESLNAAGMSGALRFGMSGAMAGGVAAGAGFGAIAYGAAKATKEAINFETAMSEVQKAVNDLTPDKLKEMEKTILSISRRTGLGKGDIAKGIAQMGFAGLPTADLPRAAEFGAKAAIAFGMPVEQTNDALAELRNNFKLTQKGTEDLGDAINFLGDATAAKEPKIIDFLLRTGATGKAIGFLPNQLAAVGSGIMSAGVNAEIAATGFNALAMKLGNPQIVHDKDFGKGIRMLHMNVRQLKTEMATAPNETFLKVLERIKALPQGRKSEAAGLIGGLEHGDELSVAADQVDDIRHALAGLENQAARSGSIEKTFKIFDATTQSSINKASAAMGSFAVKLGQRFTPAVKEAAEWTAKLFGAMSDGVERSDRIGELGGKLAKGDKLTPKEQAEVDADPDLKKRVEREEAFQGRFNWMLPRKAPPAPPALAATPKLRDGSDGPLRDGGAGHLRDAPALGGKRADLVEHARLGLAAYNEEVDRQLDRTERIVRRHAAAMREDLKLGGGIQSAALGGYSGLGGGAPRIIQASLGAGEGVRPYWGGGGGGGRAGGVPRDAGRPIDGGKPAGTGGSWGGGTAGNLTALTEQAAKEAGIDPRIMHGIRAGESGHRGGYDLGDYVGGKPTSFGPWQLHYGGLGTEFERDNPGLSIRDPKTIGAQTRWVANYIKTHGRRALANWHGYHGDRAADPRWGDSGYQPDPGAKVAGGPVKGDGRIKGFANLMHGQYGQAGANLVRIQAPSGKTAMVHAAAAESFKGFLGDLEAGGYKIDSLGGYNYRTKRGGSSLSQHAYGNAIDINPARNPFHTSRTDMPGNVSEMAAKWGLSWGGDWSPRSRDPMHFEWAGAQPWKGKDGPVPTAANKPKPFPFGLTGQNVEELERRRSEGGASARFTEPSSLVPRRGGGGAPAGGATSPGGTAAAAHITQNFHGGFDERVVARRAQLEQNRSIRRSMAGALHDIGSVV